MKRTKNKKRSEDSSGSTHIEHEGLYSGRLGRAVEEMFARTGDPTGDIFGLSNEKEDDYFNKSSERKEHNDK
jgi:hypothetical protein